MDILETLPLPSLSFGMLYLIAAIVFASIWVPWWFASKKLGTPAITWLNALRILSALLFPLWCLLVLGLISYLWDILTTPPPPLAEDQRWVALTVVGLITALGGLVGAPLALIRVFTTERQTKAQEEGLITDRINNAVRNLGADKQASNGPDQTAIWVPNIEVRIGAILELERLAKAHLEVHVQIMEILCTYIRENAKAEDAKALPTLLQSLDDLESGEPISSGSALKLDHELWEDFRSENNYIMSEWISALANVRSDVQLALTVIGRRSSQQAAREESNKGLNFIVNLDGTNLQGADLSDLNFQSASFKAANLQSASLFGTNLRGASFDKTMMQGTNLYRAKLEYAMFYETKLENAYARGAQMNTTFFDQSDLKGADLSQTNLINTHCTSTSLVGTNLQDAKLVGAKLSQTSLSGADASFANMKNTRVQAVNLKGTSLIEANLNGSEISGTNFSNRTVLHGTKFKAACIYGHGPESIETLARFRHQVFADGSTQLPAKYKRPDHWVDEKLNGNQFMDAWRAWQATLPKDEDGNFL
jgi:uncharacterized protein YjbI with pentapeptide repeats